MGKNPYFFNAQSQDLQAGSCPGNTVPLGVVVRVLCWCTTRRITKRQLSIGAVRATEMKEGATHQCPQPDSSILQALR